jgi:hypothetical protein
MDWQRTVSVLAVALAACFPPPSIPIGTTHPSVHLVFWGAHPEAVQTQADYTSLIVSPGNFFDRLSEYGVGKGTLGPLTLATPSIVSPVHDTDVLALLDAEVTSRAPDDIWVVVLPPGVTTYLLGGASAYHGVASAGYAYCIIAGGGISHEVAEAAAHREIGDACEGMLETIDGVLVQRVWSAKLGACI